MFHICVAVMLVQLIFIAYSSGFQPEYQVALYGYHDNDDELAQHFCNAVIIHSKLLITPASCLFYKTDNGTYQLMDANMIVAETGGVAETASIGIDKIFIAPSYVMATQQNDLAILQLREALPLDSTTDLSWIIIGYEGSANEICMVNFYEEEKPIMQSVQLELFPAHDCSQFSAYKEARSSDICSQYIYQTCNVNEELIERNEDRGTGLVCGSYVHGILSEILPHSAGNRNDTNCDEYALKAFYTSLAPHISWIYHIIAAEEEANIRQGNYIASAPYSQKHRIESILQSSVIDTSSYDIDRNHTEISNSSGLQSTCNLSVFLLETVVSFHVAYYKML